MKFRWVTALIVCGFLTSGSKRAELAATKTDVALADAEAARPQPAAVPRFHEDIIILTVDKKTLKAKLKTWPEDPQFAKTLKTFKIAIGKEEGDKQLEGDNKTPEGIYFAQSHIPGKELPKKYGTRAIPINFPNAIDRLEKKTGYGIWLHGVDDSKRIGEAKVTEGCVAFYNPDISKLGSWLKPYQSMVVIADDSSDVNQREDIKGVVQATKSWMKAWADRDVDTYAHAYSDAFRFRGMDRDQYRDYKKRIFDSYKVMTLEFDTLRVITHPKYAVSVFNQNFQGDDRFTSEGRKILYWEKTDDGAWKIVREEFENRRLELVKFSDAELALLSGGPSKKDDDLTAKPKSAQATN